MTTATLKELWKLCFNDSDEFIEMYFHLRCTPENTMLLHSEGQPIAMLQNLVYPLRLSGRSVTAGYISGACTHPGYRKKGYMEELLHRTFREMLRTQMPISFLIPANEKLFDYYAKLGYTKAFFRQTRIDTVPPQTESEVEITFSTELTDEVYGYYHHHTEPRNYFVRHTFADLQVVLEDMKLGGTAMGIARNEAGEIVGLLFAFPHSGILKVGECISDSTPIAEALIYQAADQYHCKKVVWFNASDEKSGIPFGMIRIIDAKALIAFYAETHPQVSTSFSLVDNILPVNNGYYTIENGEMRFSATLPTINYPALSIEALGTVIFSDTKLYMNLMVD